MKGLKIIALFLSLAVLVSFFLLPVVQASTGHDENYQENSYEYGSEDVGGDEDQLRCRGPVGENCGPEL